MVFKNTPTIRIDMAFTIIDREDTPVAFIKVHGTEHAAKAFDQLESKMSSLKGKKFFGIFNKEAGDYFACVQLDENQPDAMGFETRTIPGGRYARTTIHDWPGKEQTIGPTFDLLKKESKESGHEIDSARPDIEFYRSQKELLLLVPITKADS